MQNNLKKILVTGSNGQLGNELQRLADQYPAFSFLYTDVEQLDMTDVDVLRSYIDLERPDWVINCAAYTAVDKAESEPELAMMVNGQAVKNLCSSLQKSGGKLMHISTDYVFDGRKRQPYREDDMVNPVSVYGSSKLMGEKAITDAGINALIIRTSWLYSAYGNNFVRTILRLAKELKPLRVVNDQTGNPTYAGDLAKAILDIISLQPSFSGSHIYNYSNEGSINWYDFAKEICRISGYETRISPVSTADYPTAATRPKNSVLEISKIKNEFGLFIPNWEKSLEHCIHVILQQ